MNLPRPFDYPTTPHARSHGPQGYTDYPEYKPWLRDEFAFRCVCCLERETWYPSRAAGFSVDHFVPKAVNPSGRCVYENLVYACSRCNSFKQAKIAMLDPTVTAFADHFRVSDDGHIEGLSTEAQDLIDLLDLDHSPALDVRREALLLLRAKQTQPDDAAVHQLFLMRFGYPADLPDLRSLRPKGNARPRGVLDCHYERRKGGHLPEAY
jgi:hypothetical protein